MNLNESNNCCLYSLKKLLQNIAMNYLLSPFFYAVISAYTNTQGS